MTISIGHLPLIHSLEDIPDSGSGNWGLFLIAVYLERLPSVVYDTPRWGLLFLPIFFFSDERKSVGLGPQKTGKLSGLDQYVCLSNGELVLSTNLDSTSSPYWNKQQQQQRQRQRHRQPSWSSFVITAIRTRSDPHQFHLLPNSKNLRVSQQRYVRFIVVILSSYHTSFPYSSPPSLLGFVSKQESPTTTLDSQILYNFNSPSSLPLCDILPHSQRKFFFCPSSLSFLGFPCVIFAKSYCNNNIILAIMVPLFCFSTALSFPFFNNKCYCMKFGWNNFLELQN